MEHIEDIRLFGESIKNKGPFHLLKPRLTITWNEEDEYDLSYDFYLNGNFFDGLFLHTFPTQEKANETAAKIAAKLSLKIVSQSI